MPKPAASDVWHLWPLVLVVPTFAHAEQAFEPSATTPEFLDFIEYLGSWEGEEQDWVQFLELDGLMPPPEAADEDRDQDEDDDDAVS